MNDAARRRNTPNPRWGHGMTCSLSNTGPPMANNMTGFGRVECVMFGGAQIADDDFLDDTWLLRVATSENGTEFTPRQYWWERQNGRNIPHGRWCFSMATCGSHVIMIGGSTDFRLSADETWVWSPVVRPVELPAHIPGHLGEWTRYYGVDPMLDMPTPRPEAAGPLRVTGFGINNWGGIGSSDIILYGGVNNATGGNFLHKGWETSEMWRWPCTTETWPEAMTASPPSPPSPPPPPSLPPGDYAGGTTGYAPQLRVVPTQPHGAP